ncbi:MAG: phosphoglycerate kinase [Planctomyces sp.]|nr:phosphoglycerate kinase [Planctomyces sp.]MBA4039794.1 phosphoglycerate kinase [Planctomyces sp.]
MAKKTIAQVDVKGKRVLMRVDFNVPIEQGRITDDRRIREALPTVRSVVDRGGAVVLLSHLGRPEGKGYEAEHSLAPVASRLSELLGRAVSFPSNDVTDEASAAAAAGARPGDVVLLENVRFAKGEKKGEAAYAARLAGYGDVYVNDAFGTAHREDGSMFAVPRAMGGRPRVAGLLLDKELRYLGDALAQPRRPFVVVLGGAKVSDKIGVVENLLPKADTILVGGAMAYTFLRALGRGVGASRVEESHLGHAGKMIELARAQRCDLMLPSDHVCSTEFAQFGGQQGVHEGEIPAGFMGLDIGPRTQEAYAKVLRQAHTIVWNGPMGVFEWSLYSAGTRAVAEAAAEATSRHGAVSIVGGGDSAAAAERLGLAQRFSHVSTGGGASLEMLAGKPFTTVALLDEA